MASDGEQKRLEDAAGPHGARTTELVGVDDIGLPSGIQPEDVEDVKQGTMDPSAAGSTTGAGQQGGSRPTGGAPSPVRVDGGVGLSPGDEAAPGTACWACFARTRAAAHVRTAGEPASLPRALAAADQPGVIRPGYHGSPVPDRRRQTPPCGAGASGCRVLSNLQARQQPTLSSQPR